MAEVHRLRPVPPEPLECYGVNRYAGNDRSVVVHFNRPLTDDQLQFFHDVCGRTAPLMPDE